MRLTRNTAEWKMHIHSKVKLTEEPHQSKLSIELQLIRGKNEEKNEVGSNEKKGEKVRMRSVERRRSKDRVACASTLMPFPTILKYISMASSVLKA
ncbi:hypothetical protein HZH68_001142 [Vespula germanica]|uniref:Uncharacterized protein n=1 Tax=Vespula germanica TaxID=30212 RepID=A0A834U6F3_VESGE|nr:hypothetical protein HZH68_001142 [Vespula germanica]